MNELTEPQFTLTEHYFWMLCRVEVNICAKTETIWNLLTDARNFPQWNSTVASIDGEIREGERLRLHVPGTNRVFTRIQGRSEIRTEPPQ